MTSERTVRREKNSITEFTQSPGVIRRGFTFGACFSASGKTSSGCSFGAVGWKNVSLSNRNLRSAPQCSLSFGAGVAFNVVAFFESKRGKTMRLLRNTRRKPANAFRNAAMVAFLLAAPACASYLQHAAYGYLTPSPTGEPELIGVFDSVRECEAAGEAWASRQVVGNPVFTECLPVDRN